ncbi:MAG: LysM peptidoglycan-binding domain-containing protein [Chloroflexi bacterium]|nr:LysM peptidoglycan-binding domain-containing protein [Chloroflexota bacterium]
MNKTRILLLSALVVLSLMTGCYREAAPDVTPTPAGGAQVAPPEEGTPDLMATAAANSALETQAAQEGAETPPAESPIATSPPPTEAPATEAPTVEPATPEPTAVIPAPTPISQPAPSGQVTHVVQRGENLFRIALRYGTSVEAVASANGIANPALIYVGQRLVISFQGAQPPAPSAGATTYVVQRGDNLFRIGLRYNMSYLYLAQYNGIANPSNIYAGQVLSIPPR